MDTCRNALAESFTPDSAFWPYISMGKAGLTIDGLTTAKMREVGTRIACRKGTTIVRYGEAVPGIYFLEKGKVSAAFCSPNGAEKVFIVLKAPSFFNESWYLAGLKANVDLKADTDCEMVFIGKPILDELLVSDHSFNMLLLKYVSRKLRMLVDELIDQMTLNPVAQIHKVLLFRAQQQDTTWAEGMVVRITQDEVAALTGHHRVTVAKAFVRLKEIGFIKKTGRSLVILDPTKTP